MKTPLKQNTENKTLRRFSSASKDFPPSVFIDSELSSIKLSNKRNKTTTYIYF